MGARTRFSDRSEGESFCPFSFDIVSLDGIRRLGSIRGLWHCPILSLCVYCSMVITRLCGIACSDKAEHTYHFFAVSRGRMPLAMPASSMTVIPTLQYFVTPLERHVFRNRNNSYDNDAVRFIGATSHRFVLSTLNADGNVK